MPLGQSNRQASSVTRYGLGLIPAIPRLVLVVCLTSSFTLISTLRTSIIAFGFSCVALLVSTKRRTGPFVHDTFTFLLYFLFNALAPVFRMPGSAPAAPPALDRTIVVAAVGAFSRGAMIALSLAWLGATSIPQMYASLSWFRPGRRWVGLFLRDIQVLKQRFFVMRTSLLLRDRRRQWYDVVGKIRQFMLLLQGLILFGFEHISSLTYAVETHNRTESRPNCDLTVQDVFARYSEEDQCVLNGISITISAGEFIFLGGRSGSGRTTLMRCICGAIPNLLGSRSGKVLIGTDDIRDKDLREIAQVVKYVPPDPAESILGLTVSFDILAVSEDEASARASLATMGIEHLWDRETTSLSGGEQVRLVLAGVLASRVPIILLDSPLEQLDESGRRDFLDAIRTFYEARRCTVLVSELEFSSFGSWCTRIILLDSGTVVWDGAPTEVPATLRIECGLTPPAMPNDEVNRTAIERRPLSCALENVSVVIEGNPILKGLSLSIHAGECLVILGPNGGGKSTGLLCLAGAIKPAQGNVRVDGRIGYVFQNAALQMLGITARKELAIGPLLLHWDQQSSEAVIQNGLRWAGLGGDEWCIDLHQSQIRLLGIEVAAFDCDFLVLDEPSVGLDYDGIQKLRLRIREESLVRGRGVVVITHSRDLAEIGDRAILIREGRSIASGSPREVLAVYENEIDKAALHCR